MSYEILIQSMPIVFDGLKLTLIVTLAAFALGQLLALPIGLALMSKSRLLRWPTTTYTFLVRGSPLLVQLFILYYGLAQFSAVRASPFWPIIRSPVNCTIIAIGFNSAAYVAVIIAGGLQRLPAGQKEACISLGLSKISRTRDVLIPQVYRAILPSIGNELILVLKASSLASAVTVVEISGAARAFTAKTYAPFEVFIAAGILYLAIGFMFGIAFYFIERRVLKASTVNRTGRLTHTRSLTLGTSP